MTTEKGWKELLELIQKLHGDSDANKLLHLLFTHEERHDLSKRVLILKALLEEKQTQRELAKNLSVSIAKITRGSNAIKEVSPHLKDRLKTLLGVKHA